MRFSILFELLVCLGVVQCQVGNVALEYVFVCQAAWDTGLNYIADCPWVRRWCVAGEALVSHF